MALDRISSGATQSTSGMAEILSTGNKTEIIPDDYFA